MKAQAYKTKTARSSNLSSNTSKNNPSTSLKENSHAGPAKYANLLKTKRDSGAKRQGQTTNTATPSQDFGSPQLPTSKQFGKPAADADPANCYARLAKKPAPETVMTISPVVTNIGKRPNMHASLSNQNIMQSYPTRAHDFEASLTLQNPRLQENGFRSPPMIQKTVSTTLLNATPNSTGKLGLYALRREPNYSPQSTASGALPGSPTSYKGPFTALNASKINTFCLNHLDKKSKFFLKDEITTVKVGLQSSNVRGFCSKCAVKLVQSGFECLEIEPEDHTKSIVSQFHEDEPEQAVEALTKEENVRKERIENFVEKLNRQRENCTQTGDVIRDKIATLSEKHNKQMEEVNAHFSEIFRLVEGQREKFVNQVDKNFQKNKTSLEQKLEAFEECQRDFGSIHVDIEENFTSIVKKIDLEPFNAILSKYEEKLVEFSKFAGQLDSIQLSSSTLRFDLNTEDFRRFIEPSAQISLHSSKLVAKQQIDLCDNSDKDIESVNEDDHILQNSDCIRHDESQLLNESAHMRRQDDISKSDVFISFDQSHPQHQLLALRADEKLDDIFEPQSSNATQKYKKILHKISKSQNKQEVYYHKLLHNGQPEFQKSQKEVSQEQESSLLASEERYFELENNDNENWEQKQTPDLGEKICPPEAILSHLNGLSQANPILSGDALGKIACQKVLFQEF